MITKVSNTIDFLKSLFIEGFLNKTDKATDISPASILNATAFGTSKIAQKAIKDVAIIEAQIFPESASGDYLDRAAVLFGVSERFGPLPSSTYVRVRAQVNTSYNTNIIFTNVNGIRFIVKTLTKVDENGFAYVPVESLQTGEQMNVEANTILNCTNPPIGHIECTNEYQSIGGRSIESDEMFRIRILNNKNILSRTTIQYYLQTLQSFNPNILKIMSSGIGYNGIIEIFLATQNGANLSQIELDDLTEKLLPYLPLGVQQGYGEIPSLILSNFNWTLLNLDFRVAINPIFDTTIVRQNIQTNLSRFLDFKYFIPDTYINWDELISIIRETEGVLEVYNQYFNPNYNIFVPFNQLPRIQQFIMRDPQGNIIYNTNVLTPIFYPNEIS